MSRLRQRYGGVSKLSTLYLGNKTDLSVLLQRSALERVCVKTDSANQILDLKGFRSIALSRRDNPTAPVGLRHNNGIENMNMDLSVDSLLLLEGVTSHVSTVKPVIWYKKYDKKYSKKSSKPSGLSHQRSHVVGVTDRDGRILDPCHPARARILLKQKRAVVVSMVPFAIRLKDRKVENSHVVGVELGIDPGSKTTGIALWCTNSDGVRKLLCAFELEHRAYQIHKKLGQRAGYRRRRRTTNLRCRQPRYSNRKRKSGWLPPSVQHLVDSTVNFVRKLIKYFPIVGIMLESVRFDLQKLENPQIRGREYQQGELLGYETKEYLLTKWGHKCVYCDKKDTILEVEHIIPKARGGTNRISNLTISCVSCNRKKDTTSIEKFLEYDPKRLAYVTQYAKKPLRDATYVNTTRKHILSELESLNIPILTGSGGETKYNRTQLDIPKTHVYDALCVGKPDSFNGVDNIGVVVLVVKATGRGVYQRTIPDQYGFPRLYRPRQKTFFGFQTGDLVRAHVPRGKNKGIHFGRVAVRSRGRFNIKTSNSLTTDINYKHVKLVQRNDGFGYSWKEQV